MESLSPRCVRYHGVSGWGVVGSERALRIEMRSYRDNCQHGKLTWYWQLFRLCHYLLELKGERGSEHEYYKKGLYGDESSVGLRVRH